MHFAGVDDRDAVRRLRATLLLIAAADRPPLEDPDEFYDTDLVGLQAVSVDGRALGPVIDVVHLAGAVYLLLDVDGTERMVPFVSADRRRGRRARRPGRHRPSRGAVRPVTSERSMTSPSAGGTSSRSSPTTSRRCGSRCSARRSSAVSSRCGVHDLREYTDDVHRTVDDTPYGGGPGMVMLPEPWGRALDAIVAGPAAGQRRPRLIVPSPAGVPLTQAGAERLAAEPWLIFACGRYEGIDARVLDYAAERMAVEEISLGDYVLAGGEVAVLVLAEAIGRLLPGVLGNADSAPDDSFSAGVEGLLEAPAYTKPASWRGREVPPVLLSGNHGEIARWRREQSLERTRDAPPRPALSQCSGGRRSAGFR